MIAPPRFPFPILNPSTFSLFVLLATSKTHGAFISEHVEIRDIDEALIGLVFASQSILMGEIISTVPLNLTISAQSEYFDDEDDYDTEMCHLLHNVHSSIIKNDTIQTPYERYLTSRTHHHIPSNWSPQAKRMLKQLVGPSTAPLFWI